jgi:cell wall-associated NlpC family hydrolase
LAEFAAQPPAVQQLIRSSLALTKQNLTYTYGSADPGRGGMDCSGAIYYILREQGLEGVPRDASQQYVWARKNGSFLPSSGKSGQLRVQRSAARGSALLERHLFRAAGSASYSSMIYLGTRKRAVNG